MSSPHKPMAIAELRRCPAPQRECEAQRRALERVQADRDQAHAALAMIQVLVVETVGGRDRDDLSAVARSAFDDIHALCEAAARPGGLGALPAAAQARPVGRIRACLDSYADDCEPDEDGGRAIRALDEIKSIVENAETVRGDDV